MLLGVQAVILLLSSQVTLPKAVAEQVTNNTSATQGNN